MTIEKTLIIRKTSKQWRVILRIHGHVALGSDGETLLATFADRPVAIAPMASALVAFEKYLFPDHKEYQGSRSGYKTMVDMGVFTE